MILITGRLIQPATDSGTKRRGGVPPLLLFPILLFLLTLTGEMYGQGADTSQPTVPVATFPRAPLSPLGDPFPYGLYEHSIEFDTTSGNVRLYEELLGSPFGQPRTLTLEEYIQRRQNEEQQRLWEERAQEYTMYAPGTKDSLNPQVMLDSLLKGGQPSFTLPLPPVFTTIFGKPSVDINVNGNVVLSAGWQIDNNNLTSIGSLGSTQSAPFFDQNIQVQVTGKVGDKLTLGTDFDTQRSFDVDNKLKVTFGGKGTESDDDILQLVEAGNVALESPSVLIGGSQTLFGVKTRMKFGKLLLTNVLSQKRGEKKSVTVNGGTSCNQITLKPYDYAQNHFWIDTIYKTFFDDYYRNTPPAATPRMADYKVTDIEVYEQVKQASTPSQFEAVAYADLDPIRSGGRYPQSLRTPPSNAGSGAVQRGSFIRLERGRGYDVDEQLGIVTIKSLQRDKLYAIAYKTSNGESYGELSYTRPDSNTVAILKLIYVNNMQPSFKTLWARQMKNIYQLQGVRNVNLDNSKIVITYGVPPDTSVIFPGSGGKRIVTVLGVDRRNSANLPEPDGEFDIRNPDFFNPETGEIIFPSTEPFRRQLREQLGQAADQLVIDAIYDQTRDEAQQSQYVGRYTISGEICGTGGKNISLGYGVAPGSVKVLKNGEQLIENVDYRVDPIIGQVTLLSQKAAASGGELQVEFEQNELFSSSIKTMLGLRADYDLYNKRRVKSQLGMTFMRFGQSLQNDKIQITSGEEPILNTGIGFDGYLTYQAPFLTHLVNALPFIKTEAPSELRFSGEWAAMVPEAKETQELIDIDRGQSVAYIDDFESGAKRQIQLGINYSLWHPTSPPVDDALGSDEEDRIRHKGLFWWYNRSPAETQTKEIWPNRDVQNDASTSTVLDMVFDPAVRGIYNPDITYEANPPLDQTWGGMMRSLSFFTTNLNEDNIDFIEITLNVRDFAPGQTKLYLDLGQISEDVIPNSKLDTEDGVTPENDQRDDVLNEGEDVGIDGLDNAAEQVAYGSTEEDPARDDYFFRSLNPVEKGDRDNYRKVNGLERNVGQERGPFPDAEDLNSNRSVDLDNSYFRYEIDLNPDPLSNPQIVGSGDGNWRHYRIPLRSNYSTIGTPSFANIQFARLSVKSPVLTHIRVAELNLVGSEWRNMDLPIGDSTIDPKLDISFVNLEDNGNAPDFYTLPPGVQPELDQLTNLLKNEQSLSLTIRDLQRNERRGAIRVRPRSFDVFNYKKLRFYLHGSGELDETTIAGQPPKVIAFFRFGWDSLNYYEYQVPLLQGWNPYEIDFNELAAIKQNANPTGLTSIPVPGKPGHTFVVRGTPSLTRVQFIAFGMENNASPGPLNTTMWVNELRVVDAQGGTDWAATVTASAKLADLADINYNATRRNADFHQLEERFGDRVERTNWAFNTNVHGEKFLPEKMAGSSLPFSFSHVERVEHPNYIAQSDVEVESAVQRIIGEPNQSAVEAARRADSLRRSTETLVVQDQLAFSDLRLVFPGESWLVKDIANKFNFGFLYDQQRERSPLIEQRFKWQWNFLGGYATAIPRNFTLKPFKSLFDSIPVVGFWKDFEISFLPEQISTSVQLHRERTTEKLRELDVPSPVIRDFYADRKANFNWTLMQGGIINPKIDYSLGVRSSLTDLETDSLGIQRSGSEVADQLFFNDGRLFNFGKDNDMQQSFVFTAKPRIPFVPKAAEWLFRPTASYKVDYAWHDQLGDPIGDGSFTKSAQYDAKSTLGMTIFLKSLGDAIFGDQPLGGRRGAPTADTNRSRGVVESILRTLIKAPLFDWQQLAINYTQTNSAKNPGVLGGTGLSNLWGRSLLFRSESPDFGPGMAYQLGLVRYPHATLGFPWFGNNGLERGPRAPGINVQDVYTQDNNLTANTSRELLPGMTLTLNWNSRFGMNQNYSVINSDASGLPAYTDYVTVRNLSRTYLSLPVFFNNDIDGVVDEYAARKGEIPVPVDPGPGAPQNAIDAFNIAQQEYNKEVKQTLADVFEYQLETFSFLPDAIASYFPSLNWRLQWNGLHNLPFISPWASSAQLTHEYRGQYTRNVRETADGTIPETQTVSRGFQPLIGITIRGKEDFWKGTARATLNYNTTSEFSLVTASPEISKQLRNELQLQLGYLRRGLKLSFLGLDLKNEIEFTTDFSLSRQNTKRFNLTEFRPEGNNDGSTRISFRPAVRYTISRTVDATGFVSYEATIPDSEGSRDISRSTLKVGVDIRLKISGGR